MEALCLLLVSYFSRFAICRIGTISTAIISSGVVNFHPSLILFLQSFKKSSYCLPVFQEMLLVEFAYCPHGVLSLQGALVFSVAPFADALLCLAPSILRELLAIFSVRGADYQLADLLQNW